MYWQLIVLWYLGIFVTPSLTYSLQQCVYHRTPFSATCPVQDSPAATDQSSVLFPQTSDLDYVVMHDANPKDSSIGYISDQHHQNSPSILHGQNSIVYDSSPSLSVVSPTLNSASVSPSIAPASTAIAKRRVTIPSFEEWKKRIRQNEETDDNNRKPKRKSSRGTTNQGRETIDSVDGGFSDDVGSVFETGDPNGPVSTAENTYEEGEYIAPQQQQQKSNKKHFAQVPLKSLKERFNYAWTICAATVRDVNKEARGAQSILFESKDQYLLNKCSADKFVIINLCEEILIDTIVLANFEFFSSTFKDFRVYVANTYPTKEWQLLGQWQARNTRDLQVFKVQDSIGWFEYVKIEFLTHYGNEYYCPLSLVRVHGMPMMEYYNAVESQGLSGDGGETESLSDQHLWPADVRDDIIHPQLVTNTSEWFPSKGDADLDNDDTDNDLTGQQVNGENNGKTSSMILPTDDMEDQKQHHPETTDSVGGNDQQQQQHQHQQQPDLVEKPDHQPPPSSTSTVETQLEDDVFNGNMSSEFILPTSTPEKHGDSDYTKDGNDTIQMESEASPTVLPSINESEGTATNENVSTNGTTTNLTSTTLHDNSNDTASNMSSIDLQPSLTTIVDDASTFTSPDIFTTESPTWSSENDTTTIYHDNSSSSATTTSTIATPSASITSTTKTTHESHINNDDTRHKSTHNKEPATQESIYKIIMKRLNALEANATLSQRYLDEQNNMLNDVFGEMEKRHQDQLIFVLDRLNETASNRIDGMKRRYEQSYGELKHQMESDMREMTAKISILTDQISFEKRVSMAQLTIVVTLFVFLALSRGTMSTLSPVMIAQAEERKRRQSDTATTKNSSVDGSVNQSSQRREASSTFASMTKNKLDRSKLSLSSSNKIKLDMDGRKAASLDALKLHLAQQADLLPRIPSLSLRKTPPAVESTSSTTSDLSVSAPSTDTRRQQEQRNRRSISLNDINTHENELASTIISTHHGKISNEVSENSKHMNNNENDNDGNDVGLLNETKSRNHCDDDDNDNNNYNTKDDDLTKDGNKSNPTMTPPSPIETRHTEELQLPFKDDDDSHSGNVDAEQQQQDQHISLTNENNTHT